MSLRGTELPWLGGPKMITLEFVHLYLARRLHNLHGIIEELELFGSNWEREGPDESFSSEQMAEINALLEMLVTETKFLGFTASIELIGRFKTQCQYANGTKLMPAYVVGQRDKYHTQIFMDDLASRLRNRIQLSSDGMGAYPDAVDRAFGCDVDYGMIVKEFASPTDEQQRRYSPPEVIAVHKHSLKGAPVRDLICTSYIERSNLTVRTHCKRLARLTLSFSKKLENFKAAIALHLAYYNLVKTHGTIRCTPAQQAGIENSAWTVADLVHAAE